MIVQTAKATLLAAVGLAVLGVVSPALRGQVPDRTKYNGRSEQEVRTREAKQRMLNRAGLRGAASVTGSVTVERRLTTDGSITTLEDLLKHSDVVLVGATVRNRAWLTEDQRSVRSVFRVNADRVLAPKRSAELSVDVIIPGGRFGFGDGTWAQENTPGFLWPSKGELYIWFLRKATRDERALVGTDGRPISDRAQLYSPVSGPMGVIHLTHQSSIVRPSGGFENPLARELVTRNVSSAMLIEMVDTLLSKKTQE